MRAAAAVGLCTLLVAPTLRADDFFERKESTNEMSYRVHKPRSREAWIAMATLAGSALVVAGVGFGFHRSGNARADEVEAKEETGMVWTAARQDAYDSAVFRRRVAYASYGVGAGLAIAAAVTFVVTYPETDVVKVKAEDGGVNAGLHVAPGELGVLAGWRF